MKTILLSAAWILAASYAHTQNSLTWPRLTVFGEANTTISDTSRSISINTAFPQLRSIFGDTVIISLPRHLKATNVQLARFAEWKREADRTIDSLLAGRHTLEVDNAVLMQQRDVANQTVANLEQQLAATEQVVKEQKKVIHNQKFIWGVGGFGIGVSITGVLIAILK